MNQILITKIVKKSQKVKQYKGILFISTVAIIILLSIRIVYKVNLENDRIFSENINKNYQVYKLFASANKNDYLYADSDIFGNINIPKIGLNYPIFYGINEDLLKIFPCRFFGDMPKKKSNLCIAGHNYDDNRFFSKISILENNDLIIISDNDNNIFSYFVYDKFEINENEISSILQSSQNYYELTLLTCNNLNNKRIIVKAKTESL